MKRHIVILMLLCVAFWAGCSKDIEEGDGILPEIDHPGIVSLMDGAIIISNHPDVTIDLKNDLLVNVSNKTSMGMVRTSSDPLANEYRFKLVAEMSTLKVDGVDVQATHVKFTDDGYAFVSYNKKNGPRIGGIVVYQYTVIEGDTLEDVEVIVSVVTSLQMTQSQVNALDIHDGKVYIAGSSTDLNLGYNDTYDCAFFMAMELNADKRFKPVDPEGIVFLTSFQATSIRAVNGRVYITTGDGTLGTSGGLHIYDASDYTPVISPILDKEHARSMDVDPSYIYLMQAEPARITRFDLYGRGENMIYRGENEAMQKNAKSEMLAWGNYLFVAQNESGLRMLSKESGSVNASLDRPGEDPEDDVTNSVSMNDGYKKSVTGERVQTNMLLLANGGQGLYWYDVMKDQDGKDKIVSVENNSILGGGGPSTNYVESRGNIVFVADGLGGLKVLYFEVIPAEIDEPEPETATVIFTGVKDAEDGTILTCDELLAMTVELDKDDVINWNAVYESYNSQSCFDFNDDWIVGWEIGGRRFSGRRPNIVFTEDMLDENREVHVVAIIEKSVLVRFVGLIDQNGTKHEATGLHFQKVVLGNTGEIDWSKVYISYNAQTWITGFHKDWVIGWDVSDGHTVFDGKEPTNAFIRAMLDADDEIKVYALIEPAANVVFKGLKYDNSNDYILAASPLYSQFVKLGVANNIAWNDAYNSYATQSWPTFFNENRVSGWITATEHVLTGSRPAGALTKEMIHDKELNEIHLYAVITPTVAVWFVGVMDPEGNVLEGPELSELPNSWMQNPGPHSLTVELGASISEVGWNGVFESYRNIQWPNYDEELVIGWRTEEGVIFNGAKPTNDRFTANLRNDKIWDNSKAYVIIMYAVVGAE